MFVCDFIFGVFPRMYGYMLLYCYTWMSLPDCLVIVFFEHSYVWITELDAFCLGFSSFMVILWEGVVFLCSLFSLAGPFGSLSLPPPPLGFRVGFWLFVFYGLACLLPPFTVLFSVLGVCLCVLPMGYLPVGLFFLASWSFTSFRLFPASNRCCYH